MSESDSHRARMLKQGYRENPNRPGYYTKANPPKSEFGSAADAMAHHDTQHGPGGDLIDNSISAMVNGGGK